MGDESVEENGIGKWLHIGAELCRDEKNSFVAHFCFIFHNGDGGWVSGGEWNRKMTSHRCRIMQGWKKIHLSHIFASYFIMALGDESVEENGTGKWLHSGAELCRDEKNSFVAHFCFIFHNGDGGWVSGGEWNRKMTSHRRRIMQGWKKFICRTFLLHIS